MRVAINGAGVAGPAVAFWLQRWGHEPVLIEKAPQLRTGGYVIDFWGVGYTVAERMGILPQLCATGYAVKEVRMVDRRGRTKGGFSTDIFHRVLNERFTSLPRGELAATVYQALAGRVETLFGNSIAALEQHAAGVRVAFEQGPARDFDLVIGADGLHSTVRRMVFGPEQQFETQLGYWVAAFAVEGYRPRDELVYVTYGVPGREVARFALRNDRTMFLFVFVDARMTGPEPHDLQQRKAILHEVFADAGWECPQILEALAGVDTLYFDRVSQIHMPAWSKGRVVLLGDAANCVSLLAGEGTGLALLAAYVLAGELHRAAGDHPVAFRRYEDRLRSFIESKQAAARKFAATFAPRTAFGIWVRHQATKLLTLPLVGRYLVRRFAEDRIELPDYEQ